MKHFSKILRIDRMLSFLEEGITEIEVTEKLDGANASFRLSDDGKSIRKFSRNMELFSNKQGLNGFYNWVNDNINITKLNSNYVYFGEWLTPHVIDYKYFFNNFVLFAVFDTQSEKYLTYEDVEKIGKELEIFVTHLHYKGVYKGKEHLAQFVNKSGIEGVDFSEGVVIFAPSHYVKGNQIRTKFVSDKFLEVKKIPKKKNKTLSLDQLFSSYITQNRFDKLIRKKQDEGLIKQNLEKTDIGGILKQLGDDFFNDIIEEELENFLEHAKIRVTKTQGKFLAKYIENQNK